MTPNSSGINALAPGATYAGTLDERNGGSNRCGLCISALRGGQDSTAGVYQVISGNIVITTPTGTGSTMDVALTDLVLEQTLSGGRCSNGALTRFRSPPQHLRGAAAT